MYAWRNGVRQRLKCSRNGFWIISSHRIEFAFSSNVSLLGHMTFTAGGAPQSLFLPDQKAHSQTDWTNRIPKTLEMNKYDFCHLKSFKI